jgi:hypothetical protein
MLDLRASPRMERILDRAAEIGKLHTGQAFVGTENVLRALVEDGIAGALLRELGVADRIAERLDEIMSSVEYRTPSRKIYTPPSR